MRVDTEEEDENGRKWRSRRTQARGWGANRERKIGKRRGRGGSELWDEYENKIKRIKVYGEMEKTGIQKKK